MPDPATGSAVPVDVADAARGAGVTPVGEDEGDLAAQTLRDVVLVVQEPLAVFLAEVGVHLLGALDHDVTLDRGLARLEEAEDLVGAIAEGDLGGKFRLDDLEPSHHQLAQVDAVASIGDKRLEMVERTTLLFDRLDDLLESS